MAESRPNDLPDMLIGETRLVTFSWAGGAGANSLTDATFSSVPTGITFTSTNVGDLDATVFISALTAGRYKVLATGTLTSGETIILPAYVNVRDPNCATSSRDYE